MAIDLLENCELCYQFSLTQFPESIVIQGDLDPDEEYYFKFTDKFNNSYVTELITPDVDGNVTIYTQLIEGTPDIPSSFPVELPAGWFNKDAGKFTIEASLTTDAWEPVTMTFNALPYQCIQVQFYFDTSDKNTIV